jgi:CheY-like chemotaxis protein
MWNAQEPAQRLNIALVVEEADNLRHSIISWLRECGWLVHGATRAEQALGVLPFIPYQLIVLDSELPGIGGMDFVRMMQNSRQWRAIRLVVMADIDGGNLASEAAECGAFVARRSRWEDDLSGFLSKSSWQAELTDPKEPSAHYR